MKRTKGKKTGSAESFKPGVGSKNMSKDRRKRVETRKKKSTDSMDRVERKSSPKASSPFGPPEPVKITPFEDLPYYHGTLTPDFISDLLTVPGQFLISTMDLNRTPFNEVTVLSLCQSIEAEKPKIANFVILRDEGKFKLDNKMFGTVEEMIANYKMEPIQDKDSSTVLKMEVQRAPWLIPKGNLFIGSVCIKQTDFSHDYTANFHFTPKRNIEVAAKIIKGYCKREHMIDILQEVKGLQTLNHPNLIKYYGICIVMEPVLVTENCAMGTVENILKESVAKKAPISEMEKGNAILLPVGWGLEYLHSRNLVHRDIAARNVLYGPKMGAKLTGFNLSYLCLKGNIRPNDASAFPWRWTSPEALNTGNIDMGSDVWSYGVFMTELFCNCINVPPNVNREDLTGFYNKGVKYFLPESVPPKVAKVFGSHVFVPAKDRFFMKGICRVLESSLEVNTLQQNADLRRNFEPPVPAKKVVKARESKNKR